MSAALAARGGTVQTEALALRERKRLFDDVWLVTLVVVFVAIAVPWFVQALEVELAPIAWSLFAFGVVHLASMLAADMIRSERVLLALAFGQQVVGVLFLGLVWHLAGGLHNPLLLLVFALPVIAAGLSTGGQSFASALLAIATAAGVALFEAPELRWYLERAGLPLGALGLRADALSDLARPFPGLAAPASYHFVALQLFAVLLFAVAMLTESFRSLLMRLYARVRLSHDALGDARAFAAEVLAAAPVPSALVYRDTYKVTLASRSFLRQFDVEPQALPERDLFALIEFAYPEVVQELIAGGGTAPLVTYRAGGETRIAQMQVHAFEHAGTRLAHVSIDDVSGTYALQAGFDALDEACIVIGTGRRLLHLNRAARALVGEASLGAEAAQALAEPGLADDWWELGPRSEQERQVMLRGVLHQARCIALRVPGERDALTLLVLRALAAPTP